MNKQRMYIVSLDAFGSLDLAFAKTLPHFKELLDRSAQVAQVETVFPSLTYMCHTSIATGMYPRNHGIINNTKIQPERSSPDWYWYDKDIQVPTLFDVAHEHGYEIASFLWPVTGRNPSIQYNLTEIFPNRPWQTQVMVSLYSSSPFFAYQLNRRFKHLRNGIQQPELDDFLTAGIVETIHTKNPDLIAIHFVDLDSMRHHYGTSSPEAKEAIIRMDRRLGKIMDAMKEKGIFEETVFAVLGDHYHLDTHTVIRWNHLFQEQGWLKTNAHGAITQWDVLAKEADGSCYIYLSSHANKHEVRKLLMRYPQYIARMYTGKEAGQLGADPTCAYLLDAKEGYYFSGETAFPFTEPTAGNPNLHKATHGYSPMHEDYDTMLFISGPGIDPTARISKARLVDEGPTFLHAMGLAFPHRIDGNILYDLFLN